MIYRYIFIVTRVSALFLAFLGWQFLPTHANENVMAEGLNSNTGQKTISTNQSFLPATANQQAELTNKIFLPLITKNYTPPAPLWRFGVSQTRRPSADYDAYGMSSMRFGWYVDYSVTMNQSNPYGMEYVPIVRVKQAKVASNDSKTYCRVGPYYWTPYEYSVSPSISYIQSVASSHHGMTWLIGNETDRVDSTTSGGGCNSQDEMLPELYAQAYHDIYFAIKSVDSTAQVAISGMVEFTPLRQQYLDRVWNEYLTRYGTTMPVDVWNTHLYVLQEVKDGWGAGIPPGFSQTQGELYTLLDHKDFSKAWAQIVSLRTWMKIHGQQNKPLIITEYGVLLPVWVDCPAYPNTSACPFTPEQVRDTIMYPSFEAFLHQTDATIGYPADGNRLVQRWNWFSLDYDFGQCEDYSGVFHFNEHLAGSLFNSGLALSNPNCLPPPQGITSLGTYWKQYVQNLPIGSAKPYTP